MIINDKNYVMPELDFNAVCRLEEMGIALTDIDKKILTTVRGFLALAMDGDFEAAGKELNAHMEKGGTLEELLAEINAAVENSGFFRSLARKPQTQTGTEKTAKEGGHIEASER